MSDDSSGYVYEYMDEDPNYFWAPDGKRYHIRYRGHVTLCGRVLTEVVDALERREENYRRLKEEQEELYASLQLRKYADLCMNWKIGGGDLDEKKAQEFTEQARKYAFDVISGR